MPELLKQLKAIDANPQAYAVQLMHVAMADGMDLDNETSVFADQLDATCDEMCAMFVDSGDDADDDVVNNVELDGLAPVTPSNSY